MVLQGLSTAQYIGWVSGILFLKEPKGPPVAASWKSLRSLFIFLGYFFMLALWVDFHIRNIRVLSHESSVEKFLSLSLYIGESLFDLYFRLCFFLRAKLVARFLKALEADVNKMPFSLIVPENPGTWRRYRKLVFFVHAYHYFGAVLTSLWVAFMIPEDTRFLGFIPNSVYPVIFVLFGAIPLVSSFFVSFSFVVVSTLHIQWIFDEFCSSVQDQISFHEQQTANPMKRDLGEVFTISNDPNPLKGKGKEQILSKFEHLKLLCSQYDKICGPLVLGLLMRAVFLLISAANTILLYNGNNRSPEEKKLKLSVNVYHFVTEVSQLALLQLGYSLHKRISEKVESLHRDVILMINLGEKEQMKEIIFLLTDWKWCVSGGPGFFELDRSLLSGVVSSLMTYVTILFQLNTPGIEGLLLEDQTDMTSSMNPLANAANNSQIIQR